MAVKHSEHLYMDYELQNQTSKLLHVVLPVDSE